MGNHCVLHAKMIHETAVFVTDYVELKCFPVHPRAHLIGSRALLRDIYKTSVIMVPQLLLVAAGSSSSSSESSFISYWVLGMVPLIREGYL